MEPNIDPEFLKNLIPSTVSLIVTGVATLLIGIYFEKFRNRLLFIKYDIQYQPLATSSQTEYWGKIDVYHNDTLKKHLNFVTVKVENDSNGDIENINIDVTFDQESQILGHSGFYDESNAGLLLEQQHFNYFQDVLQRFNQDEEIGRQDPDHVTPDQLMTEVEWVLRNKKFNLPVFNRGTSITINLLVENFQGLIPTATINTLFKGIKLIKKEDSNTETGKTVIYSLIIGGVFYLLVVISLVTIYPTAKTPLTILSIFGVVYTLIGLLFLQIFRLIKKLIW